MRDPYEVLGLDKNAGIADVHDAYQELKSKYSGERFLEGDAGANAARKLSEIEQAYNDCMADIQSRVTIDETGSRYGNISSLIKSGDLIAAQQELDKVESRDAEWHYYQAVIYYKKDWVLESKKQLEIAIALDPTNKKYASTLERMREVIANEAAKEEFHKQQEYAQRAGYAQPNNNADAAMNSCCDSCCLLMCCDSCCECAGGDLIRCC